MDLEVVNNTVLDKILRTLEVPSVKDTETLKEFVNIKTTNYLPSKRISIKTKTQTRNLRTDCEAPYEGQKLGSHSISLKNIWKFDTVIKPGFVESKKGYSLEDTFDKISCPSCDGAGDFGCDECKGNKKVPCYDCQRTGKIECEYCDRGWVECPDCDGERQITCNECNGNKKKGCPDCKGWGTVTCPECKGHPVIKYSGNSNKPDFRCHYCGEKGKITCPTCRGEKEIWCEECDGRGFFPCDTCDQTGKVRCNNCDEGYVDCPYCDNDYMVNCSTCHGEGSIGCTRCQRKGSLLKYSQIDEIISISNNVKTFHSKNLPEKLVNQIESSFKTVSEKTLDNDQKIVEDSIKDFPQAIKDEITPLFSYKETSTKRNLQYLLGEENTDLYKISFKFKENEFCAYTYGIDNNFYCEQEILNLIKKEIWKDYAEGELNSNKFITAYFAYSFLTKFAHENFPSEENMFNFLKSGISDKCKDKILKKQIKFIDKGCTYAELIDFIENGSKKSFSLFGRKNKENQKEENKKTEQSGEVLENVNETEKNDNNNIKNKTDAEVSKKSRLLSLVLCFLFGWLDIHNFYVGKYIKGIIHFALVCICFTLTGKLGKNDEWIIGMFGFIWLVMWGIDFIMILFGLYKDGKKHRIKKWIK